MLCLSTKERNEKFKTNDLIFRKTINLPSGTLLSAKCNSTESLTNKSKQTVNFSNIPKIPFSLAPSKKYIIIEEFKDKRSLKNILNGIKNLKLLREQEINEIKNEIKRMLMLDDEINDILEKLDAV